MNAEPSKPASRLPRRHSAWYFRGYKFAPDVVFDVGVFDGTPWLYRSFPNARFVLIDPQAECEQRVADKLKRFDFHAVALGDAEGVTTLNVPETKPGRGGAMASILPRADRAKGRFSSVAQREVPVRRLDDLARQYDGRVGLKIDTEGFEAQVLAGAPETLRRADFVIVELSVLPRFEGVAPPQPGGGDTGRGRVGTARRSQRGHLFRKTTPPALHGHAVRPVAGMIEIRSPRTQAPNTRDKETRTWFN